jgi:asparagine synthase (glutamine-hydrolysing)
MEDAVGETERRLKEAVRKRLMSEVPLGAFLSGGVDSSYIVSRMAVGASEPVRTFSMGTSAEFHDERRYARLVAAHCGTAHTEFEVNPDAWGLLRHLVWEFGQPFADAACIPTYYVANRARSFVTVVLTGDGGDESFAGYSQHQGRYIGSLLRRILPLYALDTLWNASQGAMDAGRAGGLGPAARLTRYAHPDPLVNWGGASNWTLRHLRQLLNADHQELASRPVLLEYALQVDADFDGVSAVDRALHHDLSLLLPFCYNVKVDVATMMNGLEARSPFQDRDVIEWAAAVPSHVKMRPWERKTLLKQVAERYLPHEIVHRPKHGFSLPIDEWLRGPWASAAYDFLFSERARSRGYFNYDYLEDLWAAHITRRGNHGVRLWSLLWLEMWFQIFVDGTMRVGVPLSSKKERSPEMDGQCTAFVQPASR